MPCVYILRCSDNTLYVGHTTDLAERLHRHQAGFGAAYTATRLPVALVYSEEWESIERAIERERQIKRWSGVKKAALVRGDQAALKQLSKRRRPRNQTRCF